MKRIPGTLDTNAHTELTRLGRKLSPEPYLDQLDQLNVRRLMETGKLTIFRLNKCAGPLCSKVVPSGTHKLFCSKQCWESQQHLEGKKNG